MTVQDMEPRDRQEAQGMQVASFRAQAAPMPGLESCCVRTALVWGSRVQESNLLCKVFPEGSETQYQEPHHGALLSV